MAKILVGSIVSGVLCAMWTVNYLRSGTREIMAIGAANICFFCLVLAAVAFLIIHLLLFIVLSIRRFVFAEMPRLSLGVLAGVLFILTVATGSVAVGKWYQDTHEKEAVVVADGPVDVMEGPSSEVKRFSVEEGSRVKIVEKTATWTRLLDSEGRDGWVPAESLGMI